MEAAAASVAFAEAFCTADLQRLAALVSPALRLHGPLFSFASRDEYLASLSADPPEAGSCEVVSVLAEGDQAAILYLYTRSGASLVVAQFNRVSDGLISEIQLVFDTARVPR